MCMGMAGGKFFIFIRNIVSKNWAQEFIGNALDTENQHWIVQEHSSNKSLN